MNPVAVVVLALRNRRLLKFVLIAAVAAAFALTIVVSAIIVSLNEAMAPEDACAPGPNGQPISGQPLASQPGPDGSVEGIPQNYFDIYVKSAKPHNLDWAVLGAVGAVESEHGSNTNDSSAGAQGPMQFMPDTWSSMGMDGNGDGTVDVRDPEDAIPAAAQYLVDLGAPEDYDEALQSYNGGAYRGPETAEYAQKVLSKAKEYRAAEKSGGDDPKLALIPGGQQFLVGARSILDSPASLIDALATPLSLRAAWAEPQGWHLVDSDQVLSYEDHTAYDAALDHSVSAWNALGIVSIEEGSGISVSDTYMQPGTGGVTSSAGSITLNSDAMDRGTQNAQDAIVVHEFGHALGLGHEEGETVMQGVTTNGTSNYDVPTARDEEVYYEIHDDPEEGGASPGATPVSNGQDGDGDNDQDGGEEAKKTNAAFPLPKDSGYEYQDDWGADRPTYGGSHEGTDIFVADGTPISSVTAGKVVSNNWDDLGGWIMMIEATESVGPVRAGDQLYYAHQMEQSPVSEGDKVEAGEKIGKVGSTGEGPEGSILPEGRGRHLHLGWYDPTDTRAESGTGAMNTYPLLQWLEENGGSVQGPSSPTACPDSADSGSGSPNGSGGSGSTPPAGQKGSGSSNDVVKEAFKYEGTAYLLGGEAECVPYETMDCTCFTQKVFEKFGVSMPDHPQQQYDYGEPVSGDLQPGDLIIYHETEAGTGGHSGIYIGDGDMIHASAFTGNVTVTPYQDVPGFRGARRLVNDSGDGDEEANSAALVLRGAA